MSLSTDTFNESTRAGPAWEAAWALALPAFVQQQLGLLAVKDADTGRYVHVSDAMAVFLGRAATTVIGLTDADIFDATLATTLRAAEQTALAHGAPLLSEHQFDWAGSRQDFSVLRVLAAPPASGPRWLTAICVSRPILVGLAQQSKTLFDSGP